MSAEIVDGHVHCTEDGAWFDTGRRASLDDLLRAMDEAGVSRSALLPVAPAMSNDFVVRACREHPDRLLGFGRVDATVETPSAAIAAQVSALVDAGLQGIKVHPRLQELPVDCRAVDAILAAAAAHGLPTVFCGYPTCRSPKVTAAELTPYAYDAVAKRHPEAPIVIAHMGGHRVLDAFFVARVNPNVYLDTSYVFHDLRGSSVYRDLVFVLERLDRKLIFGSDFPEVRVPDYVATLRDEMAALGARCDAAGVWGGNLLRLLPARGG